MILIHSMQLILVFVFVFCATRFDLVLLLHCVLLSIYCIVFKISNLSKEVIPATKLHTLTERKKDYVNYFNHWKSLR